MGLKKAGGFVAQFPDPQQNVVGILLRQWLLIITATLMLVNLYLIFFWVPTDANLGIVQRVFYFHVPIAWVGYLSFFLVLLGSVGHLWKGGKKWDNFAYSSAEIGLVFTSLILITGMIWAKPVWGVWWTWDPRLTISLIMWFIYVAYFMIRTYAPNISQAARYSAVLGIFGFISVPINYFSIVWWRTVHPQPVTGPAAESGSLEGTMQMALMFSLVTFTVLFWYLLRERLRLCRYEDSVEQTRNELHDLNSIPGR